MPVQLFTEAERARRNRFPAEVAAEGVIRCFTLSDADRSQTPVYSAAHNRLGFALQLCALRLMGFVPDDLSSAPAAVVAYVARQLEVEPEALADYGARVHTRTDHLQAIQAYLGYRREETPKAAVAAIVNFQSHQPLSHHWGGGTLSSPDGQRFPTTHRARNATALPRYFGYGRGGTFYTWTSDQFSQYGTKVIPATVREATCVLDETLDDSSVARPV